MAGPARRTRRSPIMLFGRGIWRLDTIPHKHIDSCKKLSASALPGRGNHNSASRLSLFSLLAILAGGNTHVVLKNRAEMTHTVEAHSKGCLGYVTAGCT